MVQTFVYVLLSNITGHFGQPFPLKHKQKPFRSFVTSMTEKFRHLHYFKVKHNFNHSINSDEFILKSINGSNILLSHSLNSGQLKFYVTQILKRTLHLEQKQGSTCMELTLQGQRRVGAIDVSLLCQINTHRKCLRPHTLLNIRV